MFIDLTMNIIPGYFSISVKIEKDSSLLVLLKMAKTKVFIVMKLYPGYTIKWIQSMILVVLICSMYVTFTQLGRQQSNIVQQRIHSIQKITGFSHFDLVVGERVPEKNPGNLDSQVSFDKVLKVEEEIEIQRDPSEQVDQFVDDTKIAISNTNESLHHHDEVNKEISEERVELLSDIICKTKDLNTFESLVGFESFLIRSAFLDQRFNPERIQILMILGKTFLNYSFFC